MVHTGRSRKSFPNQQGFKHPGCSAALYRTEICKETCNRSLLHQVQRHPSRQEGTAGGEGRVWSCCKKPWLACSTGTQGEEQPNWIYQGSNDTAGLEHDQDRNRSDSIFPLLDLQCLGSGNTWDN